MPIALARLSLRENFVSLEFYRTRHILNWLAVVEKDFERICIRMIFILPVHDLIPVDQRTRIPFSRIEQDQIVIREFCQKPIGSPLNRLANAPIIMTGSMTMTPCEMLCR